MSILEAKLTPFSDKLKSLGYSLRRIQPQILQVNVGKLCNLTCAHCHVNAGPGRKEIMTRETIERILAWLETTSIDVVDITGGAPELIPDFRYLVEGIRRDGRKRQIIDRCNLTVLLEPEHDGLAEFLAQNEVEIVASMPCYEPGNVNAQRGDGVFDSSIESLKLLNSIGYGINPSLALNLVYNPVGPHLPPDQSELERDYKEALDLNFGIVFNNLYTIANMPIARFKSYLSRIGALEEYQTLLGKNFNPVSLDGLMCRNTINTDWLGRVYDCDFNQMLDMPMGGGGRRFVWELDPDKLLGLPIALGQHCYGCTAGSGSSCSGAIK